MAGNRRLVTPPKRKNFGGASDARGAWSRKQLDASSHGPLASVASVIYRVSYFMMLFGGLGAFAQFGIQTYHYARYGKWIPLSAYDAIRQYLQGIELAPASEMAVKQPYTHWALQNLSLGVIVLGLGVLGILVAQPFMKRHTR